MVADEPITMGGTGQGPAPYDYLMAGLGACTAITLRMYILALVPDFLLNITGNICIKPNFYLDGLSLEDAEARPAAIRAIWRPG